MQRLILGSLLLAALSSGAMAGHPPEKYFRRLRAEACYDRRMAVKKLGCRLHHDDASDPLVVDALVNSLQCDKCPEVRQAAAWSIFKFSARSNRSLLALYVSSKLDPHYMVRVKAAEAVDILTVRDRPRYKGLLESGDKLVEDLKAHDFVPGSDRCRVLLNQACSRCGVQALVAQTRPLKPSILPDRRTAELR